MSSRSVRLLGRCLGYWGLAGALLGPAYGMALLVLLALQAPYALVFFPIAMVFGWVLGAPAGLALGVANWLLIEGIIRDYPPEWGPGSLRPAIRGYSSVVGVILTPLILYAINTVVSGGAPDFATIFFPPGLLAGLASWWVSGRVIRDLLPRGGDA